jgi:hypothetical protein
VKITVKIDSKQKITVFLRCRSVKVHASGRWRRRVKNPSVGCDIAVHAFAQKIAI